MYFLRFPRRHLKGLPGMLADCLPDKFGNTLIDAWLATQNPSPESFNPVERLCYIGRQGMGALEFLPTLTNAPGPSKKLEVESLVRLANRVLSQKESPVMIWQRLELQNLTLTIDVIPHDKTIQISPCGEEHPAFG